MSAISTTSCENVMYPVLLVSTRLQISSSCLVGSLDRSSTGFKVSPSSHSGARCSSEAHTCSVIFVSAQLFLAGSASFPHSSSAVSEARNRLSDGGEARNGVAAAAAASPEPLPLSSPSLNRRVSWTEICSSASSAWSQPSGEVTRDETCRSAPNSSSSARAASRCSVVYADEGGSSAVTELVLQFRTRPDRSTGTTCQICDSFEKFLKNNPSPATAVRRAVAATVPGPSASSTHPECRLTRNPLESNDQS
mmetsp:Transcript_33273/g.87191  ORF Transcript_33273/g.87191 Transcript_33273/m.87191 type:complete len:251 (-) Transcript_33273:875-1627(-)